MPTFAAVNIVGITYKPFLIPRCGGFSGCVVAESDIVGLCNLVAAVLVIEFRNNRNAAFDLIADLDRKVDIRGHQ